MRYIFSARDDKGAKVGGVVEALSRQEAIAILQRKNMVPLSVRAEARTSTFLREVSRIWEGASQKDLVILFRQLATLIGAKVSLLVSLRAIHAQLQNGYLRSIIKAVGDDVEDGTPLSQSMAKFPLVFNILTVDMVRSGEVSGNLQKSVDYVADNIERNYELTSKVRGALLYPAFVLLVAFIIGFILITIILPRMTAIIKELEIVLPWYTKVIIAIGDFMQSYWWVVLLGIFAAIGALWYYIKSESGKKEWHVVQLHMPVLGKLFEYIYLTRLSDNLAVLLNAGIPLVKALIISSNVVGNSVYRGALLRSADEVKKGGNMSIEFRRSGVFPPIVSQMVEIGEETGKTSEAFQGVAKFYRQETDTMTRNLTALIEPILIVLLGIAVAILVFAILLPIYDIAGQL